jgi:site-specific DNA-methyltransferase (adenine-specific)
MTARVIHADCLDAMRAMPDASIDAIVTDPPYELSNDGKASAYRIFAECVLPKHPNIDAALSGEDYLPLLVSKILALSGGGLAPRPPASVPVRPVAFDCKPSRADNDVKHALERSVWTADGNLRRHAESEESEHIGSFAFKAADTGALFEALNRVGAGFVAGGLGIGFRVSPASAPHLLGGGAAIDNCDHLVGPRHDALAELVRALARAEDVPVARLHLGRCADETISADGALVLCATMLLGGAQLVRAISPARGLPTVLESRRVRVINGEADRAFTFDLVLHPVTVATTGFMGKEWDGSKVAYNVDIWREAFRVAKPGAHLVAFGGTRTYHRLACAIEDAGWEVRDCLSWLYGSGFPKSLDVSKALDKAAGALRHEGKNFRNTAEGVMALRPTIKPSEYVPPKPATDAARQWQGWGTALKPAWEPCILARKPLVGTVAANVTAHGTGAINVDACRIAGKLDGDPHRFAKTDGGTFAQFTDHVPVVRTEGRWPANVALDEEAAAMLDEQTDIARPKTGRVGQRGGKGFGMFDDAKSAAAIGTWPTDPGGGASRFFYTAKASRSERNDGCDAIEARPQDPTRDADAPGGNNPRNRGAAPRVNSHPTVKPVALMRWLVRMVTPPGGVVLDPFAGSGSTLVAAIEEGFDCIGIEREAEYVAIIEARVAAAQQRPQRVEKPKTRRTPRPVVVATTAPPAPIASAPLPGQLALTWEVA